MKLADKVLRKRGRRGGPHMHLNVLASALRGKLQHLSRSKGRGTLGVHYRKGEVEWGEQVCRIAEGEETAETT